jgi:hypothetical protein
MTTLKQALAVIERYKKAFDTGIFDVEMSAFKREEELRTNLARAIARDNPPLNPNSPQDLHQTAKLPEDTVLSPVAEALYKKYQIYLRIAFSISEETGCRQKPAIKKFSDIRENYIRLRSEFGDEGRLRSWRPHELTAFHRLCVRLARDNNMSTEEVMDDFETLSDLVINEASIYLAERLFEAFQS